jgi:hypothetical protein
MAQPPSYRRSRPAPVVWLPVAIFLVVLAVPCARFMITLFATILAGLGIP